MSRRSPTRDALVDLRVHRAAGGFGVYYMMFGPRRLQRRRARYGVARAPGRDRSHHLQLDGGEERPALAGRRALAARGPAPRAGRAHVRDRRSSCSTTATQDEGARARHRGELAPHPPRVLHLGARRSARIFRDLLAAAAARGVEVRLLYDSLGSPHVKDRPSGSR
jgi:cardiolipin synthase